MSAVGEFDEHLPLDSRPVRELRAVFECLGGESAHLGSNPMDMVLKSRVLKGGGDKGGASAKVVRTEKVGSGGYCSLVNVSGHEHTIPYPYSAYVASMCLFLCSSHLA